MRWAIRCAASASPLWVEGMVAGKGWIALALTTFATWRPARVLLGAYLFGGVTMLQFHLQGVGVEVPSQLLTMLPYVSTIVVLALISRNPAWIRVNMPASLGKPFLPGSYSFFFPTLSMKELT
jgi:general nucleoside transport system permease protein